LISRFHIAKVGQFITIDRLRGRSAAGSLGAIFNPVFY
jgi:hypothetical protein